LSVASELTGVKELTRKLNQLDVKTAVKTLRSALFKATTPVVRQMKSAVPVGTQAHRTYRKRLVAPGFSKRSIKRVTGKRFLSQGKLSIAIGVKAEDFYSVRFYDQGPYTITRRRQQTNIKASGHVGMRRRKITIKPYTLHRRPWFESVFRRNHSPMLTSIKQHLDTEIAKVVRGG
jgi:hypothetical protein